MQVLDEHNGTKTEFYQTNTKSQGLVPAHFALIINPRRACAARVTVLGLSFCLSFCLSVCLSGHAILEVRAIKSIMKDTIVLSVRFAAILKWRF